MPDIPCKLRSYYKGAVNAPDAMLLASGSQIRVLFGEGVDVLGSFDPAATFSLWDLTTMQDGLTDIVGWRVDLVEKEMNPRRIRIQPSTAE
jgi:hypothetical protein